VLYVLDEPSIGLHQRDNSRLISTLKNLRDLGNTVIVVEHDDETMLEADYVIDIGPGAGIHGGVVVAAGTPQEIMQSENSITGQYLSGKKYIPLPETRRKGTPGRAIMLQGACSNNLHKVDLQINLGTFTAITGVSGSGKSTLLIHTFYKAALKYLEPSSKVHPGSYDSISGLEYIDKIIDINQSPIGRTPRSNPATYTGAFTHIRDLFADLSESKMRGYKVGRFSFNVKGGRCESCQGDGLIKIEMHFLPDVYVNCEVCGGKRYNRETLEIKYNGKNISDVLSMTVDDAIIFFQKVPPIIEKLSTLKEVGLGYITLGQSATTLSGGEAQRVKLAKELSKRSTGKTLYILDEPTTGLHVDDIKKLLDVLHKLVEKNNTVIVIEHNMDVIKTADYIIDVGPEGGDKGGFIVAQGTPEEVSQVKESHTGQYLKHYLEQTKKFQSK
jgi:excinuclease ABC subunit A